MFFLKRAYDLAFLMLDRIQKEYSFVCDMPPDPDNEKYIKYMAPLSYNGSLKVKLLIFYVKFIHL